ncbi:12-oxophytodienoate reductase [Phytophthora megakarya]|uniref:12-oxophytodienoate reductase n=1 Tax=Phytophthora megakarya TaxID=4795 RepID=A0A225UUL5_9STRA|nr:12-oxophytodienoate reductase [Phytophthora megakarya]
MFKRTDKYGGSIENRARIMFEVVEGILSSLPSSQVAIRLSPFGLTFGCKDSTPTETYGYVVNKLSDYDLAYLHLIDRRGMHAPNVQVPKEGVTRHFRDTYKGVLVTAAGYDRNDALNTVKEGSADLVAFGGAFIANLDLVERLRVDANLNEQKRKTFYPQPGVPLEIGYTDYPFLGFTSQGSSRI